MTLPEDRQPNWTAGAIAKHYADANAVASADGMREAGHRLTAELRTYMNQFEVSERAVREAQTLPDREQAEAIRRDAMGKIYAGKVAIGDLFLLMLRTAIETRRDALCRYLADLLRRAPVSTSHATTRRGGRR
jgi:hypothetical protein